MIDKKQNNQIIKQYIGSKITDKILLPENTNIKYLIVSSDSNLDLQFYTQGDNIKGDIYAIFFGNKPLNAKIVSNINNSHSHLNMFVLSFIQGENLIDIEGIINLGKNISNSQGHLLEKNIVLAPKTQKINIKALPRLDVYSNDVQATHGVSIDRISEENLFYLNSKGLNQDSSKDLIIKGYIQNILQQFPKLSNEENMKIENMILSQITSKK